MPEQKKPKVDARALIAKLSKESTTLQQREIIAPLLPGGRIRTRLGGMVHEFRARNNFTGWGRFRPVNEREAELVSEALPWERGGYLELLPALRVILLWPDHDVKRPGTWWALPFNDSDARQRFGMQAAEPLPVFLCDPTNGAERFERVIVRVDGKTLWFEGPDMLADPTHAEWLRDATAAEATDNFLAGLAGSERLALLFWRIRQVEIAMEPMRHQQAELRRREVERERQGELRRQNRKQQREWLRQEATRDTLEKNLQHALAKADATLHSFSEIPNTDGSPGHLVVEWSEHGKTRRYRSTIDARLGVVSSGICLSGDDRNFDLTSLVSVMTDSPWS